MTSTVSNGGSGCGTNETKRLYITHVDAIGPYLRIHGQLNRDAMAVVRSKTQQVLPTSFAIDPNWPLARQQAPLRCGYMCMYKRINGAAPADCEFLRARILNVINTQNVTAPHQTPQPPVLQVEVEFVDYGEIALVRSYELLFPQQQDALMNTPALCSQYVMLGVCKDFTQTELDEIRRIIKNQTLDVTVETEFKQFKFITMKWKEFNFSEFLIHQKKIGAPVANDLLRDNFIKFIKKQQQNFSSNNVTNNNNNTDNSNYTTMNNNNGGISKMLYVGSGRGATVSNRSLATRLQEYQNQQQLQMPMHNIIVHPVQPRMPHTIGNLRSMMQGIHLQNNRIPYTGPTNFVQQAPHAIAFNGVMATQYGNYYTTTTRYQRPQPPQPLGEGAGGTVGVTFPEKDATPSVTTSPRRHRTNSATFKSNNLSVSKAYEVCVSFVENGPCLFSVQLAAAQDELTEMMNQIEHVQLKQFVDKPMLGTACIARYSEDGQLYRALITGVQPTACKVAYIDYGNAELVKFRDLYEIPDEFLEAKAFAIRFTLSGHKELEPIDESLKKTFKDMVIYQNCKLKVMPLEGPPLVQYCELYLQDKNILDVLKQIQKCRLVYPKAEPLQNNDVVEIRYIDSPKHFYVQKIANISIFEELMDDMFLYYNKNQLVPNHLALGAPCIVKYDNEWYRAEVMRADATAIIVRHVDFGYEQKVTKNLLSTIAEKHLMLPRQAIQCCLKGFENNELNKDLATNQFEMLAEESNRKRRSFTVKVFRIHPDGVNLVNLCTKDLNVMKKLYKLSMPFEQYLTLEKEEFNVHKAGSGSVGGENGHKTPSIASSSDVPSSVHSSKKEANILNSTMLQQQQKQQKLLHQQQQQQLQRALQVPTQQRHNKNSNYGSISTTEWDKNSSASSMNDRDSRSNSSEYNKQGKRSPHQQQQQNRQHGRNQQQYMHNVSITSSNDRRSNGSAASSGSPNNSYNKSPRGGGGGNQQQRLQNTKQDNNNNANRRCDKQQPNSTTPPQNQRAQRPQNAPQGYSQQRQKTAPSSPRSKTDASSTHASDDANYDGNDISEEYVPLNHAFPIQNIVTPNREEVIICWWISPHQFYTQLKSRIPEFERLMRVMQTFYKKKSLQHLQLKVGSHVIARYRKDNVMYRARVLACNQMLRKYKVHFVDFGNQYTVTSEDIWQVEKRFADFPCMAYMCTFNGIVSNYDHLHIIDRMEKYLPSGAILKCDYIEREQEMYYVNVSVNNVWLKDTLKTDGIITEISPDLRLNLLGGQQIRAKISSIKDMLNFKIEIEGLNDGVKLLCSHDDLRYVKSNPDVAQKFKEFYEGKSCVVNIKDVSDNKVILLRPLLPLLKEDIPTFICTYPIIFDTFQVRVVYVASAYRLYAQALSTDMEVAQLLDDMYEFYENGGTPLKLCEIDQICAAKGGDGNWYRARIIAASHSIEVHYIDYGNAEKVEKSNIKQLEQKFYVNKSAYAIGINLPVRPLVDQQHKNKPRKPIDDANVINQLKALTLEQVMTAKALEVRNNHLIADLCTSEGTSIMDDLQKQQLIKGRDVEYMRRLIENDNPNMLQYIEMVDLTLEDEDEPEKRQQSNKLKTSSPKKKKTVKTEDSKIDNVPTPIEAETKTQTAVNNNKDVIKAIAIETTTTVEVPEDKVKPEAASLLLDALAHSMPSNVESIPPDAPRPAPCEPESEAFVDPYFDMEHAILSHCDNPAQFFVHPCEKIEQLRKLQENLQIVASSLPPLMSIINGGHCISLYSVDKQWYRAKIMDAELMCLQFIDYGNTDCVSDTTDVKEMMVFSDIEPLCMPCALPIKPKGTADWVDAANAIFNDSYSKMLNYEYITRGDNKKRSFINLYIDGVNIAEKLVEDGFAKPLEVVTSGENCYISHVNGITDFFIQYEKDSKALELIEIYLSDNEKLKKVEKFEHSKIVAALFPDDEMWYRAKLLHDRASQGGYEVLFIDYGNTSISRECREISDEIAKLPPLSKKCALELAGHCLGWSAAAEEKFAEIAALGETIFTVELREPAADHAIVHLLIDAHNINDDLEPLCDLVPKPAEDLVMNTSFANTTMPASVYECGTLYDAFISHANSPCDFYVQFNKDVERLTDMTSSLNSLGMDALVQPEVGQLCAAIFNEDNSLYRARVMEIVSLKEKQYRVIFIDFGNEAITGDLRVLPQDLLQLKEFSKNCQLENAGKYAQMTDVAVVDSFNALIDECDGLVKVDILDDDCIPAIVKAYAAKTEDNLCEKLNALLGLNGEISGGAVHALPTAAIQSNTCLISHAISPMHFYIQPKSNSVKMEFVVKSLQKPSAEQLAILNTAEVGRICSVFSTEDDCYYRGRVERVLPADDGYEIFLLDYGNSITATQIRELPVDLCSIPALALKCKLDAVPNASESILDDHFSAVLETHFGEIFEIEMDEMDAGNRVHTVKLQVNYKDLAEELASAVEKGTALNGAGNLFSPVPTLHDCSIIHVNSPTSFYIQLADDVAAVEKITDVLLDAETNFEPFAELSVGAVCAAQFPDDLAYYRAEIVQLLDDGKCEVHYLDFGNNSVTDQFRRLPESMRDTKGYSKHCALDVNFSAAGACIQFSTFIDSRFSETFQVEFLKTTVNPNICRIFYQNKNVATEVSQLVKGEGGAGGDDGDNPSSSGIGSLDADSATGPALQ